MFRSFESIMTEILVIFRRWRSELLHYYFLLITSKSGGYSAFSIFSNTASVTEKIAVLETLAVNNAYRGGVAASPNIFAFGKNCSHLNTFSHTKQKPPYWVVSVLVGEGGFEPPKLKATDLQSAPFGRSGILPYSFLRECYYSTQHILCQAKFRTLGIFLFNFYFAFVSFVFLLIVQAFLLIFPCQIHPTII